MTSERKNFIGNSLKYYRLQRNWSQEFVGEKLGVTANAYGKRENGITEVSVDEALVLCSLYGITMNDLFQVKEEEKNILREEEAPYYIRSKPKVNLMVELDGTTEKAKFYIEMIEEVNKNMAGYRL